MNQITQHFAKWNFKKTVFGEIQLQGNAWPPEPYFSLHQHKNTEFTLSSLRGPWVVVKGFMSLL